MDSKGVVKVPCEQVERQVFVLYSTRLLSMYTAPRGRPAQAAGDNGLQLLGPDSSVDRSLAQGILRLSSCPA